MPKTVNKPIHFPTIVRLVTWIMPSHRKGWAHAMLNELGYIKTRRAAARWIIGSMLFVIKERTGYELEKAFMNMKIAKTALTIIAMAVCVVAGTYAIQKPYQQERIKFALHRLLDAKQT